MRDLICEVITCCASSLTMGKLSAYDQIGIKNVKRRRDRYQTIFYVNFHVKADLRMEFIFQSNEIMQEGALTSFSFYDIYRKNTRLTKNN